MCRSCQKKNAALSDALGTRGEGGGAGARCVQDWWTGVGGAWKATVAVVDDEVAPVGKSVGFGRCRAMLGKQS